MLTALHGNAVGKRVAPGAKKGAKGTAPGVSKKGQGVTKKGKVLKKKGPKEKKKREAPVKKTAEELDAELTNYTAARSDAPAEAPAADAAMAE